MSAGATEQTPNHEGVLTTIGERATGISAALAVAAIILYGVLRIAYSVFYHGFGLTPDDLGLGYGDLLVQSAVGTVLLLVAMLLLASIGALFAVGCMRVIDRAAGVEGRRLWLVCGGLFGFALVTIASTFTRSQVSSDVFSGTVVLASVIVVPFGVHALIAGLRGDHAGQWWRGIMVVPVVVFAFAIWALLQKAKDDRARVLSGHPASFTLLGFPITSWRAEDATVRWTNAKPASDLTSLTNSCLLYLGESGGTAFLYRATTHRLLRISTGNIVIHTGRDVCSSTAGHS